MALIESIMAQSQSLKHDLLRPWHLVLHAPVRLPSPGGLGPEALSVRLHTDEWMTDLAVCP